MWRLRRAARIIPVEENRHAVELDVQSFLGSHAGVLQDTLAGLDTLRNTPNAPHPFLYGPQRFARDMDIMLECGRARVAALEDAAGTSRP